MNCPVCENNTFDDEDYGYDICPECFWEYDELQVENPDEEGGANCHSLNEYRKMYWSLKKKDPKFSCRRKKDRQLMIDMDHGLIPEP